MRRGFRTLHTLHYIRFRILSKTKSSVMFIPSQHDRTSVQNRFTLVRLRSVLNLAQKNLGARCRNVRNFAQRLKFKIYFYSKTSVCRHTYWGLNPQFPGNSNTGYANRSSRNHAFIRRIEKVSTTERVNPRV